MAQTAKDLLTAIHDAMMKDTGECDSSDNPEEFKVPSENEASFTAVEHVNAQIPGTTGFRGIKPLGHFEFEVSVKRKWVPFDDE